VGTEVEVEVVEAEVEVEVEVEGALTGDRKGSPREMPSGSVLAGIDPG